MERLVVGLDGLDSKSHLPLSAREGCMEVTRLTRLFTHKISRVGF